MNAAEIEDRADGHFARLDAFSDRVNLNVAPGVGVTRDTPDVSLAVRVPVTF